ncbi:MAG: MFS transporter [Oscillospiraceae bacterium]|nr:MFS transporter [Oscillospiraceae bacterium]MBQ7130881.1 MFS transporter [Oscillospiraceae bacterium]
MTQTNSPLTLKHRIGYALGDFGGCMTFSLMSAFMTRYYVNVALMDTAVIAAMTLIWKIFDALSNPVIGVMMDKSFAGGKGKGGKFRPWILRVAPLTGLAGILVFTAPGWVTGMSRLVVAFVTYLMYEVFYAMQHIALGGLISAMAKNDAERAELSSARGIGGMLGIIIPQMMFPAIISLFESNAALGYGMGVTVCAVIGYICCLGCYFFTEERNVSQQKAGSAPIQVTDILEVFRVNRAFLALCLHGLLSGVLMSVGGALGTYMYADVLGSLTLMSVGSMIGMPVSLVCMSVVPKISRKLGSQKVLRGSLLLGCGLYVGLFLLHITTSINVWVHIGINAIASGISGLSNMMQWGMLSEAIEYNEYLTGKRTEGSINGTFNMLRRLGQGLGASCGVALLGLIGYNASASVQSDGTILGIKVLCLLFPAICALGSWVVFRFVWNITPELREKMAAARQQ